MTEDKDMGSLVMSEEQIPLPATVDGVLEVLKQVLSKPFVQSVSLNSGEPIRVVWYKAISDSLNIGEPEDAPEDVLAQVDLEEFTSSRGAAASLVEAVFYLNQRNLHATHLFVGSLEFFKDWQGIPSVVNLPEMSGTKYLNYLSINLLEVPFLEEEVVVLLASGARNASTTETTKALKIAT